MIEAAINKILQLNEAKNRLVLAPDYGSTGEYFTLDGDGDLTSRRAARPLPGSVHHSTQSLVDALRADAAHLEATPEEMSIRVYYSRTGVTATVEDDARWKHTLHLEQHPVFESLVSLTRTQVFNQKQLIRFLRAELNGHVDETVIEVFRNLKLQSRSDGHSVVAKGREGVDRSIQREVRAATGTDVPDEITVHVPVYDLDELREETQPVTLLLDVTQDEAGQAVFEVTTVLNTLREAEFLTLEVIAGQLKTHLWENAVLLHGKPS